MKLRSLLLIAMLPLLSGCSTAAYRILHPYGPVAESEMHFTLVDVGVMLLIILPVTVMIAVFVWRYRKSRNAEYDPTWSHSMGLELAMWGIPFLTVIFLGYESYRSTLQVNPYDPGVLNYNDPANPAFAGRCGHHRLAMGLHLPAIRHRHGGRSGGSGRAAGKTLAHLHQRYQ